jgi:hypothetical protein
MNGLTSGTKRLCRLRDGRLGAGVRTGVGAYVGVDGCLALLVGASVPYAEAVPRRADTVTTVTAVGAPIV